MLTLVETSLACRRSPEIPCNAEHQGGSDHAHVHPQRHHQWRQEITVQKDREYNRVTVRGISPEMMVSAEDARDLSSLFAGVEKMLTD